MTRSTCPDCEVPTGQPHVEGCDVARCLVTGLQWLSCEAAHDCGADIWTGRWPEDRRPYKHYGGTVHYILADRKRFELHCAGLFTGKLSLQAVIDLAVDELLGSLRKRPGFLDALRNAELEQQRRAAVRDRREGRDPPPRSFAYGGVVRRPTDKSSAEDQ